MSADAEPRFVDRLARFVLDIFFRRIEVVGVENVPTAGPLVFVGNHQNSLLDPALLLGYLPVRPRFLAKSTLWQMAGLRPFLDAAAAIPVYRRQDPGVDASRNAETFARCHEVLRAGGAIALFPEGRSHNEPGLVPLRTGVSRIVLEAEERFADEGGVGVRIVPVGLLFDDKSRFRSRALLWIGPPLDPSPEIALHAEAPREAVGRLTERVREALAAVTLNYPSWREARLIERAADLWSRPRAEAPAERPLAEVLPIRKDFVAGYRQLLERCPDAVHEVADTVERYDQALASLGLHDAQLASRYPAGLVVRFVLVSLFKIALWLPLGAVGTVLHTAPYLLVDAIARRFGTSPDVESTYKVFPSLVVYPLWWLALASLAGWLGAGGWLKGGWLGGLWAALATLLLAPLAGLAAVRLQQRFDHVVRQSRAFLVLRGVLGDRGVDALRRLRAELLAKVDRLVEIWRSDEQTVDHPSIG
ncbi:MAG: lysophospholipid acyltransferase family protein [Acidobacteriota bacterium]